VQTAKKDYFTDPAYLELGVASSDSLDVESSGREGFYIAQKDMRRFPRNTGEDEESHVLYYGSL